jgi:hypothetical protein
MEGFSSITTSILKHWTLMQGLEARKEITLENNKD